jgi:CRISPR-associated exonuclease Cas4
MHPERPQAVPHFSVLTDPEQVLHPLAHRALSTLQELRRHAQTTTPALLLAEAAERLAIWPILAAREGDRNTRAAANVEAFFERARPYGVRGLKKFVRDLAREWRDGAPHNEGRVDAEGDAIEIITIHSAKGLEWPVVIPINTCTLFRRRESLVYRGADETLHWLIGDVVPPDLFLALDCEDDSLARERERLWYVACTRARELLVVPELPEAEPRSWARIVDLAHQELPALDLSRLTPHKRMFDAGSPNRQTPESFAADRAVIAAASKPLHWLRPSEHDPDRMPNADSVAVGPGDAPETELPVGAGRVRGLVLHKLMEEVLTGELQEDAAMFAARARVLMAEIVIDADNPVAYPDAEEIAATARRTLLLPEIAALRSGLLAEWPVYAMLAHQPEETALAGRIDAIVLEGERPSVVLDWKSDVAPTEQDIRDHARQLRDYLDATRVPRGALVYMTPGIVRWISSADA